MKIYPLFLIVILSFSCSDNTSDKEVPMSNDTIKTIKQKEPWIEIDTTDYSKHIPSLPTSLDTIKKFMIGKRWKAVHVSFKNLDPMMKEKGVTEESLMESKIYRNLLKFEFTPYKDSNTIDFKLPQQADGKHFYEIAKVKGKPVLITGLKISDDPDHTYVGGYPILGANDSLLYIMIKIGYAPADSYIIMKKQ